MIKQNPASVWEKRGFCDYLPSLEPSRIYEEKIICWVIYGTFCFFVKAITYLTKNLEMSRETNIYGSRFKAQGYKNNGAYTFISENRLIRKNNRVDLYLSPQSIQQDLETT